MLPEVDQSGEWSLLEEAMIGLFTPGHRLLHLLEGQDVASLGVDDLHEHLADLNRVASVVAGMQHLALATLERKQGFGAAEVAASALSETTSTAERLMGTSSRLVAAHPAAMAGLLSGTVGARHATVLATECASLPAEVAREVDARVWDEVGEAADPSVVRREARRLALDLHAEAQARRVKVNRDERHVECWPGPEGTTWLAALLATEDAMACKDSLNARTATRDPDDPRSRPQRTADLLVQDLTGRPPLLVAEGRWVGPPSTPGDAGMSRTVPDRRVEIGVLIPFDVLAGLRDGHATVDGQPVPACVARGLFQSDGAVMRRMLTDPETGHLLDRAFATYKPGKDLKAFVVTRDQECWWPGCHARARVCDLDHKVRFPNGTTTRVNVGALCEHHHRLKHSGGWGIHVRPDGTVDLTGPDGHTRHLPYPRLDDGPIDGDPPPGPGSDPPPGAGPGRGPAPRPALELDPPIVVDCDDPPPF